MSLSDYQQKRYARQIALEQIGVDGQEALFDSSVLIVGAGGLGNLLLTYLSLSGIGKIGIVDSDRVDLSNLHRQFVYKENEVGKAKALQSKNYIQEINKEVSVTSYQERLNEDNAKQIISDYDIIADCTDNFSTRFLLSKACHDLKKILVSGAVIGFTGQVSVFKSYLGEGYPCYNCFCPEMPKEDVMPSCASNGVLGSVVGVIGSIQSSEVIKEILQIAESLSGNILRYNALTSSFKKSKLSKNKNCLVCSYIPNQNKDSFF